MKTLAIRLEDELHTRLSMLSKLSGTSLNDTIRVAIEKHLDTLAADPAITAKAEEMRAAIEQEAAQQQEALAALLGAASKSAAKPTTTRGRSSTKG